MKPHKGSTNKTSQVELPSKIAQVRWTRATAVCGGTVGLEIHTSFVGNGSDLQIELSDANGKKHGTFKEQIAGNRFWADISIPTRAEKALIATAKLPKHGLEATSPALFLQPPVKITNARWDKHEARRGDLLTLSAEVEGADDGSRAEITLWEHDANGAHDLVAKFPVLVVGARVEAEWLFVYRGDTRDIPSDDEAENGYVHPQYFFRVVIGGASSDSNLLRFLDSVEIIVRDLAGRPFQTTRYVVHLADGSTRDGKLTSEGLALVDDVPPGKFLLEFPDL